MPVSLQRKLNELEPATKRRPEAMELVQLPVDEMLLHRA